MYSPGGVPNVHQSFVCCSQIVYKLAYARQICMIIIIITVYLRIFVSAMGQPIKFSTHCTK